MRDKLMLLGLLFSIACLPLTHVSFAAEQAANKQSAAAVSGPPDATIEFDTQQYQNIFAKGRTGLGTLQFQKAYYPFTATIDISSAVIDKDASGVGTVHRLKKPGDFLGTYRNIGAGHFQNSKGVIITPTDKSGKPPANDIKSFVVSFVGPKSKD